MPVDLSAIGFPEPEALAHALRQITKHLGPTECEDVAVQVVDAGWRIFAGDIKDNPDTGGTWAFAIAYRCSDCRQLACELITGLLNDAAYADAQEDGQ
jgi:hypothetical protein